jgi:hypothetical protein
MTDQLISFERVFHVELHYYILSCLDLGRDAASIFSNPKSPPAWSKTLLESYTLARPKALELQFTPLLTADLNALLTTLRLEQSPLFAQFADILELEAPAQWQLWQQRQTAAESRIDFISAQISEPLHKLRHALFALAHTVPTPPLQILDTISLGRHARGLGLAQRRYCAISLNSPPPHILCQIFHEETHAISDPIIVAQYRYPDGSFPRDTHIDTPGYTLHQALEKNAILLGQQLISDHAPEWLPSYRAWQKPFRLD